MTKELNHWDQRIKTLMEQVGHPDSMSLYQAFKQLQNELTQRPQAVPMTCTWVEDDETGNYATTCGHVFAINDGGPADNGMKFCCYCGGGITAQAHRESKDDKRTRTALSIVRQQPSDGDRGNHVDGQHLGALVSQRQSP